jgi:hypothetical protein
MSSFDSRHEVPADKPVVSTLHSEDWQALFSGFSHIVLVANSDEVNIENLETRFPPTTLFVFFNKVFKVLHQPFMRPALLLSRSGTLGANLAKSGKVDKVLPYFPDDSFLGVVNVKIASNEQLSPASDFGNANVRHLDLTEVFAPFYPRASVPTTGFALCFWLTTLNLGATITLAGFSSKRSERYKVLDVHDWTFEQVVLRLMFRRGKIDVVGRDADDPYGQLTTHFPEYSPAEIALTADEVLGERLVNLSSIVDRLMHVTRFFRFLDRTYKRFKPKSQKQRQWEAMEGKGDQQG